MVGVRKALFSLVNRDWAHQLHRYAMEWGTTLQGAYVPHLFIE